MNPLDDMLPEENEPQYKELITLVQHASPRFAPIPLERQQQILARVRERLLKADLKTTPGEDMPIHVLGAISPTTNKPKALARRHHPNALVAALLMIVLFGTTLLFLRSGLLTIDGSSTELSLEVSPATVPLNGIITLHGTHFHANVRVGLMRDMRIAIIDTNNNNIISADGSGSFTDTVFVDAAWGTGPHTIRAEDALTHKTASSPITVSRQGASPRPPHLVLSQTSLDLGAGDQATNSTASLTVADDGGGEISWQSATTQPWLALSPQSGTFTGQQPMQVTVAVDRATLSPGTYSGEIIFTSYAGRATVSVHMAVIPLAAGNEAVLEVAPAVLSFTGTDGGANPPMQTVTLSNPGVQSFPWNTSTSTKDGGNWLAVSPQSGTVAPQGGNQSVKIGVNLSTMLPGVYSGSVTFSNAGAQPVQHSPQTVFVSLTVQTQSTPATFTVSPACALAAAPVALTFAGLVGGIGPNTQPATISASGACGSDTLNWSAAVVTSSGGSWLNTSPSAGSVSLSSSTTTSIGVSVAGLSVGTYTGTVTITAIDSATRKAVGTPQVIIVTLNMTAPPALTVGPSSLTFNVTTGTSSQPISIGNVGGQPLNWSAVLASDAPSFVSLSAGSGSNLAGGTSTSTNVVVTATGVAGNQTFTTSVSVSAVNPATDQAIAGSPATVSITINVAPLASQVSSTNLSFNALQGSTPPSQTIAISNTGGDGLHWTVGVPSAGWLTTAPRSGSDNAGQKSSIELSVAISNLAPGTYSATGTITPSVGSPVTINVTLVVNPGSTPTPLPTPNVMPGPAGSASFLLQAHRRV